MDATRRSPGIIVRQAALLHAANICHQQGQRYQRLAQRASNLDVRQKHAANSRIAFDCEIAILESAQEELRNAPTLPTGIPAIGTPIH